MDTNTLQAFLAVAETGSFSLAAERLFLTQPAVSKRIAALEEDLAVRLFERLGRRVLLTEAGNTLLPRARSIVRQMEESRRLIADLAAEVSGVLQVATSHHVGLHRLPGILREYSLNYPRVDLDLHFMDSEQGCAAVASGNLELAVVTLPQAPIPRLGLQAVWEDPLMIMVSRSHPLAAMREVLPSLLDFPAIVPERATETRRLIEQPFQRMGLNLRIGIETNYLETIRMLVTVGLGWSVLPLSMLSPELVSVELPQLCLSPAVGLGHPYRPYPFPCSQCFQRDADAAGRCVTVLL